MEIAETDLKKVFAGKHVESLAVFGGLKPDQMPSPFVNALVVRCNSKEPAIASCWDTNGLVGFDRIMSVSYIC